MYGYLVIKTNGYVGVVESEDYHFTLQELYNAVGCNSIELVRVPYTFYMCVDDNGKMLGKAVNPLATWLYGVENQFVVGDVVFAMDEYLYEGAEPDIYKMPLENCYEWKELLERKLVELGFRPVTESNATK